MEKYRLPAEVRYRVVADEAVILRLAAGRVLGLNWTGTRILALLEGGASESEVVDQLVNEVEADQQELAADVAAFIQELMDAGVIERQA
ncbi:MAG: PqqD family protein [Thermoanaerobaculia bacterium]|nr:PqqD family protein [Thermoanaerobaculia bacterium]